MLEAGTEVGPQKSAKFVQCMKDSLLGYGACFAIEVYAGRLWCRICAQVYFAVEDFEWVAAMTVEPCDRVRADEWR